MSVESKQRFYVIRENAPNSHPTYIHDTESGAVCEAQRLARNNRGARFIVVRAVRGYRVAEFEETRYNGYDDAMEPPF